MIESYQSEVTRKRRAARIFWFLVFFFATFLYFFFQWYYPDIQLGLKRILSEDTTTNSGNSDLIKSFGIINISVKSPTDAKIVVESWSYINNEKRMTSYGKYIASVTRDWYVSDIFDFVIDKETPYYITQINLLKEPQYRKIWTGSIYNIAKISDSLWIESNSSWHILLDKTFSWSIRPLRWRYLHIWEWNFLSWSKIFTYNIEESNWENKIWSGSSSFIEKCSNTVRIRSWVLSCESSKTALTEKWKILTGVLLIQDNYIRKDNTLLVWDNYTKLTLTWWEINSSIFIEKNWTWYSQSGGVLVPIRSNQGKKVIAPIITPLENIQYADWIEWELILIWNIWTGKYLIRLNQNDSMSVPITFPDIEIKDVRIIKNNGNIFIKTQNSILFLYNDSKEIKWIIDGSILAFSELWAIYNKDGVIWRSSWNDE